VLSLVAQEGGEVCGHVGLSRLKSPQRALALAPVSVLTARQGQGIGSALVRRAMHAPGISATTSFSCSDTRPTTPASASASRRRRAFHARTPARTSWL
jgi:N-acetylglutamate synthase-like GNAT family acetyltransferase